MKEIICRICLVSKKEIEFTYLYFKKRYVYICKLCENNKKK